MPFVRGEVNDFLEEIIQKLEIAMEENKANNDVIITEELNFKLLEDPYNHDKSDEEENDNSDIQFDIETIQHEDSSSSSSSTQSKTEAPALGNKISDDSQEEQKEVRSETPDITTSNILIDKLTETKKVEASALGNEIVDNEANQDEQIVEEEVVSKSQDRMTSDILIETLVDNIVLSQPQPVTNDIIMLQSQSLCINDDYFYQELDEDQDENEVITQVNTTNNTNNQSQETDISTHSILHPIPESLSQHSSNSSHCYHTPPPSPIHRINEEFYMEMSQDITFQLTQENNDLNDTTNTSSQDQNAKQEKSVEIVDEDEEKAKLYHSQVEFLYNERKLIIEKEAEARAVLLAQKWQTEKVSLEAAINESFRDYGELLEKAHALRLLFEHEKTGWQSRMLQQARDEAMQYISDSGFTQNNRSGSGGYNSGKNYDYSDNSNQSYPQTPTNTQTDEPNPNHNPKHNTYTNPTDRIQTNSSMSLSQEITNEDFVNLPTYSSAISTAVTIPVARPFQAPAKRPATVASSSTTATKKHKVTDEGTGNVETD